MNTATEPPPIVAEENNDVPTKRAMTTRRIGLVPNRAVPTPMSVAPTGDPPGMKEVPLPPPKMAPPPMTAPTPAPNRIQLATQAWDTFQKSTGPQYEADLRRATQLAAGQGNMGSGGLRTSYGNIANQRAIQLDTKRDELINKATEGMIGDDLTRARLELDKELGRGSLDLNRLNSDRTYGLDQQRIQLAKDQLAAEGARFGLSLAQQKELAILADKTANRQMDISSAQGKNALLLELARIMGAKDLSNIDPNFLAAIAKALGLTTTPPPPPPPGSAPPPTTTVGLAPANPADTSTAIPGSGDRNQG